MGTDPSTPLTPDLVRLALVRTRCVPFPIDVLAEHIAGVAEHQRRAYVERRGDGYSWSFVHGGGPYPLLREVASFVRLPYTSLVIQGRAVRGWCVMLGADNDDSPPEPDVWAVLELTRGLTPFDAELLILDALNS